MSGETASPNGNDLVARRHRAILALAALDKSDLDGALKQILAIDAELLPVARVNCWRFEEDASVLRCVAHHGVDGAPSEAGAVISSGDAEAYFQAVIHDPVVIADDARTDPRTRCLTASYLMPRGISSMLDVPVWVGGRLWGVVCHEHVGPPRTWTDAERDFALSIGHVASMAVEAHERAGAQHTARLSEIYMGVLSHDLRTPLSLIRSGAEVLLEPSDEIDPAAVARRIRAATHRIDRMIGQLLDFTRIRLGSGLPLTPAAVDLSQICRDVVSDITLARPETRVNLAVTGSARGRWDPDRLWQLVANLVANAVDHTPRGGAVTVHVDGGARDEVRLTITNPGRIPEGLVPVIFDLFRHPEKDLPRRGLGLGLFIARQVTLDHGGTIALHPGPDETVFEVCLPRQRIGRRPETEAPPPV